MTQRDKSEQKRKENGKLGNRFVNEPELIGESQEYDSDLDNDPKKCMECPEVFMDWSDLSDHIKKVH